jgi:hypothetical protein
MEPQAHVQVIGLAFPHLVDAFQRDLIALRGGVDQRTVDQEAFRPLAPLLEAASNVEADKWFTIAASNGSADAVKAAASAESVMTPDQIRQAHEKAAEWAKAHQ